MPTIGWGWSLYTCRFPRGHGLGLVMVPNVSTIARFTTLGTF